MLFCISGVASSCFSKQLQGGSSLPGVTVHCPGTRAGRAKDTIVLASGENVEPQPIEDLLCCSPHIKFAVLVGSGHRALGALVVTNEEALQEEAAARGVCHAALCCAALLRGCDGSGQHVGRGHAAAQLHNAPCPALP